MKAKVAKYLFFLDMNKSNIKKYVKIKNKLEFKLTNIKSNSKKFNLKINACI